MAVFHVDGVAVCCVGCMGGRGGEGCNREKEGSKGSVHIFKAVPRNYVALCRRQPKHIRTDVCIALGLDIVERSAAPNWVKDEAEWPLLRQGRVHLAEAVCVAACASVSHNASDLRRSAWWGVAGRRALALKK